MDYWAKRLQQQQAVLYDKTLEQTKAQLVKQYQRALKATIDDAKSLFNSMSASEEIKINDLYRYNRYFELKNNLNQQLQSLGAKQIEINSAQMLTMYERTYKLVGSALDNGYAIIDTQRAQAVLNSVWCADGKHWSSRVWSNTEALQQRIEKSLVDCVSRGVPKDEIIKVIKNDFSVGFNQADRIARTELSYVQNKSAADTYKEAGYEKYQFLTAIDERTSDICEDLNGQEFYFSEAEVGVNFPPCHCNCRSTIIAVK